MNSEEKAKYLTFLVLFGHFLYISVLIGITIVDSRYIAWFDKTIQFFIGSFLIYKFGIMYTTNVINEFDRKVIVYSAIFLLTNLLFTMYAKSELVGKLLKPFKTSLQKQKILLSKGEGK
jgi:hypothetical protein